MASDSSIDDDNQRFEAIRAKMKAVFAAFEANVSDEDETCLLAAIVFWTFIWKLADGNGVNANRLAAILNASGRKFTKEINFVNNSYFF